MRELGERYAALLLAAAIVVAWQVAVPLLGLSAFVLPTPLAIAQSIGKNFGLLASSAMVTLFEVVAGFSAAIAVAIPLAFSIFYWRTVERAVYPLLAGLQTVPKVALAPLFVLYLGYGWGPKIGLSFLISFFPIVVSTVVGLQSLDKALVSMVRSMGASEWQLFYKLRLPAALPSIFGGLRVAISLAIIGAIIGEYIAAEQGLGYLQMRASSQFDTALNFAAVVTISLLGIFLFFVLAFAEQRATFRRASPK